jgi:signal transduction histidine kinase
MLKIDTILDMDNAMKEGLERSKEELQKKVAELEELNRSKNSLLSFAAHQMKAPLGVVKGYATLLGEGQYGAVSEKQKEILRKMEIAIDGLVELIANVIDLKKIEEGKMEYEFSRTDLVGLAKDVAEGLEPLAENKKLKVLFTATARDIFVQADPRELKHVVQNLLDNAIKYTSEGSIKVEVRGVGKDVVFSVTDSGMGIPAGVKPLLFGEFIRDERVGIEIKGSGIGLHIAKSIVEAHGGKIWCESKGEGRGSTFLFSLPRVD